MIPVWTAIVLALLYIIIMCAIMRALGSVPL